MKEIQVTQKNVKKVLKKIGVANERKRRIFQHEPITYCFSNIVFGEKIEEIRSASDCFSFESCTFVNEFVRLYAREINISKCHFQKGERESTTLWIHVSQSLQFNSNVINQLLFNIICDWREDSFPHLSFQNNSIYVNSFSMDIPQKYQQICLKKWIMENKISTIDFSMRHFFRLNQKKHTPLTSSICYDQDALTFKDVQFDGQAELEYKTISLQNCSLSTYNSNQILDTEKPPCFSITAQKVILDTLSKDLSFHHSNASSLRIVAAEVQIKGVGTLPADTEIKTEHLILNHCSLEALDTRFSIKSKKVFAENSSLSIGSLFMTGNLHLINSNINSIWGGHIKESENIPCLDKTSVLRTKEGDLTLHVLLDEAKYTLATPQKSGTEEILHPLKREIDKKRLEKEKKQITLLLSAYQYGHPTKFFK